MELHPRVKGKIGKKNWKKEKPFLRKVEFNAIETLNNNTKIKPRGVLIESTETAFTEIDY
jgi:hypothetical protein